MVCGPKPTCAAVRSALADPHTLGGSCVAYAWHVPVGSLPSKCPSPWRFCCCWWWLHSQLRAAHLRHHQWVLHQGECTHPRLCCCAASGHACVPNSQAQQPSPRLHRAQLWLAPAQPARRQCCGCPHLQTAAKRIQYEFVSGNWCSTLLNTLLSSPD